MLSVDDTVKYGTVIRKDQKEKLLEIKKVSGIPSSYIVMQALDLFFAKNKKFFRKQKQELDHD